MNYLILNTGKKGGPPENHAILLPVAFKATGRKGEFVSEDHDAMQNYCNTLRKQYPYNNF